MTPNQAQLLLDDFASRLVLPMGFSRIALLRYARPANDLSAHLSFPCRIDGQGLGAFTVGGGVRFESLMQWLEDNGAEKHPTLAAPIHFLRENRSYTEWKFSNANELQELQGVVLADLTNLVIPFIEKYSHWDEFRKVVSQPFTPQDRFILSQDQRIKIRAILRMLDGDKAGAIQILDDALLHPTSRRPNWGFDFRYLRNRLQDVG